MFSETPCNVHCFPTEHCHIFSFLGDFTQTRPSKPCEYKEFVDWFSSQPHRHKLLISGNRDGFMDTKNSLKVKYISIVVLIELKTFCSMKFTLDFG